MNHINKTIIISLSLFLFLVALPFSISAEETIKVNDVEVTGERQSLTKELDVEISNLEDKSSLKVFSNQQLIYTQEEYFQEFNHIYHWSLDESTYILLEQRVLGSGSTLTFSLLEIVDGKVNLIQQSDSYLKGNLSISDNLNLEISYPRFKESDNLATPSQILLDSYSFNNKSFVKTGTVDITSKPTKSEPGKSYSFNEYVADIQDVNPSPEVINQLLTKKAKENGIPPEILKAIAWQESGWQQFRINNGLHWDENDVVIGYDGLGIGIMQISIRNLPYNQELLYKTSIEANIDKGIEILLQKWNYGGKTDGKNLLIPTINNNSKDIIENWYFAIMAYNGIGIVNNPIGTKYKPYQDLIYEHIKKYGLFNVTPFPKEILKNEVTEGNRLYFKSNNYTIDGLLHTSNHYYGEEVVALNQDNVQLTNPDQELVLQKGEILQIVGPYKYVSDRLKHYVEYPVKTLNNDETFFVRSSALKEVGLNELNGLKTDISGYDRYTTSAEISRVGWKGESDVVVLGRGDIAVDALTGSILAKKFNAPLLLTQKDNLPYHVSKEIDRHSPTTMYLLGGKDAISMELEQYIINKYRNTKVIRISGDTRYNTAIQIAKQISTSNEIMIATDNELSPDSLAIGPVAATKQAPILLSTNSGLTKETIAYIKNSTAKKIYLIGAENAVPNNVQKQLKAIGYSDSNIVRVAGSDRYRTSIEIINHFNLNTDNIVFSNGEEFIDALPGTPFASTINAPIVLVKPNTTPWVVENLLKTTTTVPKLYFLGGNNAITQLNRTNILNVALKKGIN